MKAPAHVDLSVKPVLYGMFLCRWVGVLYVCICVYAYIYIYIYCMYVLYAFVHACS